MEKTIYIPGDLVMTNGIPIGTKKGIVYQVTESNADKYAKVEYGDTFTELKGSVTLSNLKGKTIKDDGFLFCDSGAWVKDIVPIPLTPSILEKNGWKNYCYGLYWFSNEECTGGIGLSSQTGYAWKAYIGRHLLRSNINSVSDLQHLIFGLGLNSEMEV